MAPPWGYASLFALGFATYFLGATVQIIAFPAVVCFFLIYYIKEIKERKIRIAKGLIQHGFYKHELSTLRSIGTIYTKKQVLPTEMVLTFRSGDSLKLKLSSLKFKDYEAFLRHIENKHPHCQIDPVLSTLVRCKSVARRILVEDEDKVIIQYDGHRKIKQFIETFYDTAGMWLRTGPTIVLILAWPMWVCLTSAAFMLGRQFDAMQRIPWFSVMAKMMGEFDMQVATGIGMVGTGLSYAAQNRTFSTLMLFFTLTIIGYMLQLVIRPNAIIIDDHGLSINFEPGFLIGNVQRLAWATVTRVGLVKTETHRGTQLIIRFDRKDGTNFDVDFSAVTPRDRPRLMKALDRFAPNCTVDSDLVEAMMPKQEHSYTELWLQSLSGNPERNSTQPLTPGRQLQEGRYLVEKRLGVGGQGTAYLCKDTTSGAQVVLKETIIPVFADPVVKEQALKRFESEADMLRKLDSEQVVKMEDCFFEDHRGYIVLEHVDGDNLRQIVSKNGPMPEDKVLQLADHMCEILSCLHEQSIIHRDFTPDNLILANSGTLKLIDFNVAQIEKVGATGTIAGKHAYLPPEQFRGKATLQSDIYALGATLYFLLTGKDPEAISCSSPREANASVSEELDSLVKACTDIRLSHRLKSAQEVKEQLQKIVVAAGPEHKIEYKSQIELAEEEAVVISLRTKELNRQEA